MESPQQTRRRSWWRFITADLFRIAFLVTMLVALIALRKPCSEGVAQFFETFDPPPDAAPAAGPPVQRIDELSEEDIKKMFPHSLDAGTTIPAN